MESTARICPRCGKEYVGYPALSREDNETEICPDCGTEEALIEFYSERLKEELEAKKLVAKVEIEKSFDEGREFSKEWKPEDFRQFFEDEGKYLDRLCGVLEEKGLGGDKFTVTYTVTVEKARKSK